MPQRLHATARRETYRHTAQSRSPLPACAPAVNQHAPTAPDRLNKTANGESCRSAGPTPVNSWIMAWKKDGNENQMPNTTPLVTKRLQHE